MSSPDVPAREQWRSGPPTATMAPVTGTMSSPTTATRAASRVKARRARLVLGRVDPWSVMKLAFLLAVALAIVAVVAVFVLWSVLDAMGVFDSVGRTVESVTRSSDNAQGIDILDYVGLSRVLSIAFVLSAVNVVLMTALCTLSAFLYNMAASLVGGLHVTFTEDVATRFLAYGWNIVRVSDANDLEHIEDALSTFRKTQGRPTLIILDSHIGYGSPHRQDTAAAHGEPLGDDEVKLVKRFYGWPEDAKFLVPDGVREHFAAGIGARGATLHGEWTKRFASYRAKYPDLAKEIDLMQRRELPAGWDHNLPVFPTDPKGIAGRDASGKVLNVLAQNIPWFLGGAADLGPSTKTFLTYEGSGDFQSDSPGGKNLHFGIREHSMAAIVNGLSLSKIRAFGATFFIFSDYARPAIRLSALMELPAIFIFTHDAMGDGEDGPTHQPVEHLASLRAVPGLVTLRPGDANEVVEAYRYIMQLRHQPAVLILSRQPLPTLDRSKYAAASGLAKGAYVLADPPGGDPQVILIASGSEVSLVVQAHEALLAEGIRSRVVSMPSWDIFDHQSQQYRESVLPSDMLVRLAVKQASTFGWERYVGSSGRIIGMHTFGASAPLKELQRKFGFEPEQVVTLAKELLGRC